MRRDLARRSVSCGGRWRRGLSRPELLVIGCAGGAVFTLGAYVGPGVIRAAGDGLRPSTVERVVPEGASEREVFIRLEELCNEAVGVLGVWDRSETRGSELLLWTHDHGLERTVESSEVMLLSYSPALRVVTAYVLRADVGTGEIFPGPVDASAASWWRSRGDVERRILATGLEMVRFARVDGSGGGVEVRVDLMWEVGSSEDAPVMASFGVRAPWVGEGREG